MKRMTVKRKLILGVVGVALAAGFYQISPWGNTHYAPQYNAGAFRSIR